MFRLFSRLDGSYYRRRKTLLSLISSPRNSMQLFPENWTKDSPPDTRMITSSCVDYKGKWTVQESRELISSAQRVQNGFIRNNTTHLNSNIHCPEYDDFQKEFQKQLKEVLKEMQSRE